MENYLPNFIKNPSVKAAEQDGLYRDDDTGAYFRSLKIKSKAVSRPVTLSVFAEPRFNSCDVVDMGDPELLYTFSKRTEFAFGESAASVKNAVSFCKNTAKTVVIGSVLDYLSHGGATMFKKYVVSSGLNITAIAGRYDFTKRTGTHTFDQTPLKDRVETVKNVFSNDIFYTSEVLDGSLLVIAMTNASKVRPDKNADFDTEFSGHYMLSQCQKLKSDLDYARTKGLAVLIFQSEPIYAENVEQPLSTNDEVENFDFTKCVGNRPSDTETDKSVYALIANSADVICGIVCGGTGRLTRTKIHGEAGDVEQISVEAVTADNPNGRVTLITVCP